MASSDAGVGGHLFADIGMGLAFWGSGERRWCQGTQGAQVEEERSRCWDTMPALVASAKMGSGSSAPRHQTRAGLFAPGLCVTSGPGLCVISGRKNVGWSLAM